MTLTQRSLDLTNTADGALVAAWRAGDKAAFDELVRPHAPRLLSVARQIVGPDAAEDALQEAMIDAYQGLDRFAGHSAIGTWLYRITVNRCLAERRKRRPEIPDAEPLDLVESSRSAPVNDPEAVAARRMEAETVRELLARLPEPYRNVLLLHDGQGLSAAQVANELGIPLGTAKSHIRRSRLALCALLTEGRERKPEVMG